MQFKAVVAAIIFATGALAIAKDPVSACNCPNNCGHKVGSPCKYDDGRIGIGLHSGYCKAYGSAKQCV